MKKIILIFTVLAFTCLSSECLAQRVTTHTVDAVTYNAVIDNSTLPFEAIKNKSDLNKTTGDDAQKNEIGQMKPHVESDVINLKASPIFAVAKNNVSGKKTFDQASVICASYIEGDSKTNVWRLPTYVELLLMSEMADELNAVNDQFFTDFALDGYWSSTGAWVVNFVNGGVYIVLRTQMRYVRCIRDL